MISRHGNVRPTGARLPSIVILLAGCALAGVAACAEGEQIPLFDNTGGKSGAAGGQAGSSSGSSGSVSNGGSGGSEQGGAGQGGSAQGGAGQGGSSQGGSAGATGGSSGTGGSAGNPSSDAGMTDFPTSCGKLPLGVPPVSGQGVTLQYQNTGADPADATISFNLELTASTTLALNQLEVCYFFTNEVTSPTTLELYYAGAGNAGRDITTKIRKRLVPAALGPGIDSYLSYSIDDTGSVAAGEKIKINPAFHSTDYQQKSNENNDWSYDGTATNLKDNPRIAVYLNGTLIWGGGPSAPTPEGGTDAAPGDATTGDAPSSDAAADALSDSADQPSPESAIDAGSDVAADASVE